MEVFGGSKGLEVWHRASMGNEETGVDRSGDRFSTISDTRPRPLKGVLQQKVVLPDGSRALDQRRGLPFKDSSMRV